MRRTGGGSISGYRAGIVAAVLFLGPGEVWCQQYDRRARDEPEVCLETGGRYGTCDVLGFTPDGHYLYAAGDDKVVRLWPCKEEGSVQGTLILDNSVSQKRTLRWRAWRDQLGGIKAVSVSPDGQRVAVGGYGLRISSVAILDCRSGQTVAITWPRGVEGQTHYDAVTAVAFDPTGERVAFGTADGSLWLWKPEKLPAAEADGRTWSAPICLGRYPPPASAAGRMPYNFPCALHFADRHTLWAVSYAGQVVACQLPDRLNHETAQALPAVQMLFGVHTPVHPRYPVHQGAWSPDGRWLAVALKGPLVLLRSSDGQQVVPLPLPADHFPRCLAWRSDSRMLAVGVGSALPAPDGQVRFFLEGNDHIRLYTLAGNPKEMPEFRRLSHRGRVEALAFHPQRGEYLAVAGGDADEVTLLRITERSATPSSVIRGAGRRLYGVNLSEDGAILGIQTQRQEEAHHPNARGAGPWVRFHLGRLRTTADTTHRWVGIRDTDRGWRVVPDSQSRFVWYVTRPETNGPGPRWRLALDVDLDQAPTCYTFVPTPEDQPPRLLVGHYYGCSLFEIDPGRVRLNPRTGQAELPRSKLYIGHGGEVHAIVADAQGQWFVTASSDQTVAAWSLADWPSQRALGASFADRDGQLTVTAVDVGSPAWEAGLSVGDTIVVLAVDGELVWDRRSNRPPKGTLQEVLKMLRQPQSGIEYFFAWQVGKGLRASPTRLKQRPLWKWFPVFDAQGHLSDSVLWMWHGNYYTAFNHGDRYVGWHVNAAAVDGTPQFYPMERFQHLFLKPEVIRRLLQTRSVAEALRLGRGNNPLRQSFREVEPPPLELAVDALEARGATIPIRLTVRAEGNDPDLLPERVELWLNDFRYQTWELRGQRQFHIALEMPTALLRSGENQITALAYNPARGRAEQVHYVQKTTPSQEPRRLYGLAVGVNDYSAHRTADRLRARGLSDLICARNDAVALHQAWLAYQGPQKYFASGEWSVWLDNQVRRLTLQESLARLENLQRQGKLHPDDLVVIFFACHGDVVTEETSPPSSWLIPQWSGTLREGSYVLCCHDYAPDSASRTAIRGEELIAGLSRLNCRKLVLLDTCRSGRVIEGGLLRRLIPLGQGPTIIAACDLHEQSYEDAQLEHGVFTQAILEALGQRFRAADRNSDGSLTVEELYQYVARRVPELLQGRGVEYQQHPVCFPPPHALPRLVLVTRSQR
jgi:WD40 repeat protein